MGLFDGLGLGQGSGLFDALLYRSPLLNREEVQQPQYDAMGNYTGITPQTQSPFPLPQMSMPTPGQYAPPSPFNGGVATTPFNQFAGVPVAPQVVPPLPSSEISSLPPNAQPTQGVGVPPQATQAQPSPPIQIAPQERGTPPAFLQAQSPDGLAGAARGFLANAHSGPLGAVLGGVAGALGMGQGNPQDVARQNLKAQYDALVPLVGQQKAMLAVMNPEAGKTILAQALEKKQYGFTKLDNDTIVANDPTTGKSTVSYGGGGTPGTITGPDGQPIAIPPGVDRKTFVNEVSRASADAAVGKKTEVQAKSEKFGNRMELAERSMKALEKQGTDLGNHLVNGVPLVGNYLQSADYQKYKQASSAFITALLRDESGAAIQRPEFARLEKEMFPQPGDTPETIQQKRELRRVAIEGMKKSAGPGYKSPAAEQPKMRVYNPTTRALD